MDGKTELFGNLLLEQTKRIKTYFELHSAEN